MKFHTNTDKEINKQWRFGAVVMLDALGARAFSLEESVKFINARDLFLNGMSEKLEGISTAASDLGVNEKPEVITFGDTIVLIWPLPEDDADRYLLFLAEWLRPCIMAGLMNGILFRGAFTIDYYIHHGSTVIGPAIADVASWYEAANWLGIVATPGCGHRISLMATQLSGKTSFLDKCYVQYDVPLSGTNKKTLWAVAWPEQYHHAKLKDRIITDRELFLTQLIHFSVPKGTEAKYEETIHFFDWYKAKMPQTGED
jgi:hypothetical protein